jgi:hypothetical protein
MRKSKKEMKEGARRERRQRKEQRREEKRRQRTSAFLSPPGIPWEMLSTHMRTLKNNLGVLIQQRFLRN